MSHDLTFLLRCGRHKFNIMVWWQKTSCKSLLSVVQNSSLSIDLLRMAKGGRGGVGGCLSVHDKYVRMYHTCRIRSRELYGGAQHTLKSFPPRIHYIRNGGTYFCQTGLVFRSYLQSMFIFSDHPIAELQSRLLSNFSNFSNNSQNLIVLACFFAHPVDIRRRCERSE